MQGWVQPSVSSLWGLMCEELTYRPACKCILVPSSLICEGVKLECQLPGSILGCARLCLDLSEPGYFSVRRRTPPRPKLTGPLLLRLGDFQEHS